jgi:hypothetical protein
MNSREMREHAIDYVRDTLCEGFQNQTSNLLREFPLYLKQKGLIEPDKEQDIFSGEEYDIVLEYLSDYTAGKLQLEVKAIGADY